MATHSRTEHNYYSRRALEALARHAAHMALIGDIYFGTIGEQIVEWDDAGGCTVLTGHTPSARTPMSVVPVPA